MASQVSARLSAYMQQYTTVFPFSGTVLLGQGSEVLYEGAFGQASIEQGIPVTPDTKFHIFSVTKQFGAMAVLILQERGLLSVHDPACKYLPEIDLLDPHITLHQLLNHTSGAPNYTRIPEFREQKVHVSMRPEEIVALSLRHPLDFEPGRRFAYSNTGYLLLGLVIERLSGQTLAAFLQKEIFDPLGMKDTCLGSDRAVIPGLASGYYLDNNRLIPCERFSKDNLLLAGGLVSTARDLFRWKEALRPGVLVSQAALDAMMSPYESGYGYGLEVGQAHGRRMVAHDGGFFGYLSCMQYYPDDDVFAVALSNYGFTAVAKLCQTAVRLAFGQEVEQPARPQPYPMPPESLAQVFGRYSEPGCELELGCEDGQVFFRLNSKYRFPIYPTGPDQFFSTWIDEGYAIERDDQGRLSFWGTPKID